MRTIRAYTLEDALKAMEAFFGGKLKTDEQHAKMQKEFNGNIPFKMEHPKGLVKNREKEDYSGLSIEALYNRRPGTYIGD